MPLRLGTSGWQYRHWREAFYPREVAQARWLEFYADRFDTVELNNSFYHLPKAESYAAWARRTPPGFCFAVKLSRFISHVKKLADPEAPLQLFLERALNLGPKLGPLLLQLPPTLHLDVERLGHFLDVVPRGIRVAVELRHASWFTDEVRRTLEDHGAALVLADAEGPVGPAWRTADWGYLRFHAGTGRPSPCYRPGVLEEWADRVAALWGDGDEVFAYFNNDPRACALRDAVRFGAMMRQRGWEVGRTPVVSEVRVGDIPPPAPRRATR